MEKAPGNAPEKTRFRLCARWCGMSPCIGGEAGEISGVSRLAIRFEVGGQSVRIAAVQGLLVARIQNGDPPNIGSGLGEGLQTPMPAHGAAGGSVVGG